MKNREVVITGIGVVSANGLNREEYAKAIQQGVSGIKLYDEMVKKSYKSHYAAWIDDGENDRWEQKYLRICKQALQEMLEDGNLSSDEIYQLGERTQFHLGSSNLGSLKIEEQMSKLSPEELEGKLNLNFNINEIVTQLVEMLGIKGICNRYDAACASGAMSIGEAFHAISLDHADLCIAGGADVLCDVNFSGFNSMDNLDPTGCKPFDQHRNGITLGEGAAFVILEERTRAEKRNAKIYGRIFGYHTENDAYHVTAPDPSGLGAYFTMNNVLKEIDHTNRQLYINTHGTGTNANDSMEIKAMEKLAEENDLKNILFSSTKSMIGHTLGASGSMEFVAALLGMEGEFTPLSISVATPMDFDHQKLQLVTENTPNCSFDLFLSNSFAFAGQTATIGVEKI